MASREVFNRSHNEMEDIWDDTALIQMYEESIRVTIPAEKSGSAGWKVGDKCTAPYPDDELWYRATISRIEGKEAFVIYEGFEDDGEAAVSVNDLAAYVEPEEEEESNTENGDCAAPSASQTHRNQLSSFEASVMENVSSNPSTFLPPFAPPPPAIFKNLGKPDEALSSMLMSWYMSGYHTGCYVTMQQMRQKNESDS